MITFLLIISLLIDVFVIYVVLKRLAIPGFISKLFTILFILSNVIILLGIFVSSSAILQYLAFLACIVDVLYIFMALILMWVWPSKKFFFPVLIIFTILAGIDIFIKIIIGIDIYVLKSFSMAKKFIPSNNNKTDKKGEGSSKNLLDSGKQLISKNKDKLAPFNKIIPNE